MVRSKTSRRGVDRCIHKTQLEKDSSGDWEEQYGTEEAIEVAAEEWGISTYRVKQKVKEWEDSWH